MSARFLGKAYLKSELFLQVATVYQSPDSSFH